MKGVLWALGIVVVVLAVVGTYRSDRKAQALVAENRQFLKERDSVLKIINEHADSARAFEPRIEWRERVVTRLVTKTDTLHALADSLALEAQYTANWKSAYDARTKEADTLRVALNVARLLTDDAVQMASYWQLAFIADSTRREEAERRLAATNVALEKRTKWFHRISAVAGVDLHGKPNAVVGYRLWP